MGLSWRFYLFNRRRPYFSFSDPMSRIFPRMTKCTFQTFGPSGSVATTDALCILPLNILNEKIFLFLWFWSVLLSLCPSMLELSRLWSLKEPFSWARSVRMAPSTNLKRLAFLGGRVARVERDLCLAIRRWESRNLSINCPTSCLRVDVSY